MSYPDGGVMFYEGITDKVHDIFLESLIKK